MVLNSSARITYLNAAAARLLSQRADALVGKDVWEAYPDAVGTPIHREYLKTIRDQTPLHSEILWVSLQRWFDIRAFPIPNGGIIAHFHDITEWKRAEARLQQLRGLRPHGAESNAFNINLGDTIYSDTEVGGVPPRADGRGEVGEVQAEPRAGRTCASSVPRPGCTTTGTTTSSSTTSRARERRRDLRGGREGVHRLHAGRVHGRDRALPDVPLGEEPRALLPRRALVPQREGVRAASDNCRRAGPGADRASGRARRFRARRRRSRNPVAAACLAAIHDPARTMLGARQYAAFTKAIKASTATWKVIVNEVPIQQFYALPYDRWEGYAAEREQSSAPPGERQERRLPDHRHAREPVQRRALPDARPAGPRARASGRWSRPGRDEDVREGDRRRPRQRGRGDRDRRAVLQAGAAERCGHALRGPRHLQLRRGDRDGAALTVAMRTRRASRCARRRASRAPPLVLAAR